MRERRADRLGLTLAEVVVTLAILGAVAGLLLPVLLARREAALAARCRSTTIRLYKGVRMYFGDYESWFPLAWHEGAGSAFGEADYGRFLIHRSCDTNYQFRQADDNARKAWEFEENVRFWSDPATGLTNDYVSPPATFRLPAPDEMARPYSRHTNSVDLSAAVPERAMPLLTDAAASIPQEHGTGESRTGIVGGFKDDWFTVDGVSYDAFYGVARSWVGWDPVTNTGSGHERFDFRHGGAVNVIFLDGNVDTIKQTDTARLRALHEAWNIASEGAP